MGLLHNVLFCKIMYIIDLSLKHPMSSKMNIFFLSFNPQQCAAMYCDQHVNKILLEIVQMLYTAWHTLGNPGWNNTAPFNVKRTQRGYRKAHLNHPMTMWVRSSRENYVFTTKLGIALALEFYKRYNHVHACSKHVLWLYENVPDNFVLTESPKAYYSSHGYLETLTRVPECMPEQYHQKDIVGAYMAFYRGEKLRFARWRQYSHEGP